MDYTQEKLPKTLHDSMNFEESDLNDLTHDGVCVKLLNEDLIKKILWNKLSSNKKPYYISKEEKSFVRCVVGNDSSNNSSSSDVRYRFESDGPAHNELTNGKIKAKLHITNEIEINSPKLGRVVVKRGSNGFSQRLGFVDVFCLCNYITTHYIMVCGEKKIIAKYILGYNVFFKVRTSKVNLSNTAREMEYYRDALSEIESCESIPFLVCDVKLPITQFDVITFDEIGIMEGEG